MKATINDRIYDTETAECICTDASPDGDDQLYRTEDGKFFLEAMSTFLDGVKLRPGQCLEDRASELGIDTSSTTKVGNKNWKKLHKRSICTRGIILMTDREALIWCVKTQMPDCFRGYVLESI